MAVYISIHKVGEDPTSAEYTYETADGIQGRLKVEKASGQITLLQLAPNDDDTMLFQRASHKINKHWKRGELPSDTCWAS